MGRGDGVKRGYFRSVTGMFGTYHDRRMMVRASGGGWLFAR
jgi:hypothetical protein